MAKQSRKRTGRKETHPGSSPEDARKIGGEGDFGVREDDVAERTYTSQNTKRADRGAASPRAGENEDRTSGVGGNQTGVGSSSGGDLDTDIIGLDGRGGVSASGNVNEPPGPDDATGTSKDFASGPLAQGKKQRTTRPVRGSTVQQPDEQTIGPQGADAASGPATGNDASVGEVSSDEASGRNDSE
jgi:hypothetical protein